MTGTPSDNRCRWAEQHLAPYLLGQATPEERAEAARHLRDCPICTAETAELSPTADALALADPDLAPPALLPARQDALLQRILAATAEADEPARIVHTQPWRRRLVLTAAAAVVVVLGAVLALGLSRSGAERLTIAGAAGVSGVATLKDEGRATRVEIDVSGLPPGLRYRAWLERCDGQREPLGGAFEPPPGGKASVSATADLDPRTTAAVGVTGSDHRDVGRADLPGSCRS